MYPSVPSTKIRGAHHSCSARYAFATEAKNWFASECTEQFRSKLTVSIKLSRPSSLERINFRSSRVPKGKRQRSSHTQRCGCFEKYERHFFRPEKGNANTMTTCLGDLFAGDNTTFFATCISEYNIQELEDASDLLAPARLS